MPPEGVETESTSSSSRHNRDPLAWSRRPAVPSQRSRVERNGRSSSSEHSTVTPGRREPLVLESEGLWDEPSRFEGGLVRARHGWCERKRLPVHVNDFSVDKNSHLEFPENVDAQHRGCLLFPPTRRNCVETVLLAAQTLLYHRYTFTIFEIEGRWRAHGNEESSEEACKEEEVVPVP